MLLADVLGRAVLSAPSRDSEQIVPAIRRRPSQIRIDPFSYHLGDRDAPAGSGLPEPVILTPFELNLCADHAIMSSFHAIMILHLWDARNAAAGVDSMARQTR